MTLALALFKVHAQEVGVVLVAVGVQAVLVRVGLLAGGAGVDESGPKVLVPEVPSHVVVGLDALAADQANEAALGAAASVRRYQIVQVDI